ncbi:hypothetical protein HGRIS_011755 [Hohenbuehelia grisea]|uniref:FAD/NAD(P)-binding domain-containing protein n=1 Tax=Hohenbuehelia grisea TaxID=104357 RepID=A0ABR3JXT2_9AGAR
MSERTTTFVDKVVVFSQIAGLIVQLLAKKIVEGTYTTITRLTYKPPVSKTYINDAETHNIVILGASFAGYELTRLLTQCLPSGYRIVLVERNDSLHDCWLFPRLSALKGSELEPKAFIPYGGYIRSAREGMVEWVRSEAQSVEYTALDSDDPKDVDIAGYVHFNDGLPRLPFAFLVAAIGVPNPAPSRTNLTDTSSSISLLKLYQDAIEAARRIILVGGGAVGVQLATDIKSVYPEKSVTLVHSREHLLGRFGIKLHYAAMEALEELGVDVVLSERLDLPTEATLDVPKLLSSKLTLKDGRVLEYDLLIPTVGATPPSSADALLPSLSSDLHGPYLPVRPTLQIVGVPAKAPISDRVFAIGDVCDPPFPVAKMGRAALAHGVTVRDNILALIKAKGGKHKTLSEYRPEPVESAIKLNLGIGRAALWCPGPGGRSVVMKSTKEPKDLRVDKFRWFLGVRNSGNIDAMATATRAKSEGGVAPSLK